jgi:hypothetical protein
MVENVCLLTVADEPGELAAATARLAEAGVRVNYVYGCAPSPPAGGPCTVVIRASDPEKVEALWEQKG